MTGEKIQPQTIIFQVSDQDQYCNVSPLNLKLQMGKTDL